MKKLSILMLLSMMLMGCSRSESWVKIAKLERVVSSDAANFQAASGFLFFSVSANNMKTVMFSYEATPNRFARVDWPIDLVTVSYIEEGVKPFVMFLPQEPDYVNTACEQRPSRNTCKALPKVFLYVQKSAVDPTINLNF